MYVCTVRTACNMFGSFDICLDPAMQISAVIDCIKQCEHNKLNRQTDWKIFKQRVQKYSTYIYKYKPK
jgi:hypothetical protein